MFFFCLVFAMPLCASVYMCLVVTCWERADLLELVCQGGQSRLPDLVHELNEPVIGHHK